jgi:hypothetical protein
MQEVGQIGVSPTKHCFACETVLGMEFGPILAVIVFGPELAWPNWNAKFGPKIISK